MCSYSIWDKMEEVMHLGGMAVGDGKQNEAKKVFNNSDETEVSVRAAEAVLSPENVFMGCLNGQIRPCRELHQVTRERYGFSLEDAGALFIVWLGNGYESQKGRVRAFLESVGNRGEFSVCVLPADAWHLLTAVVYRPGKNCKIKDSFDREYEMFRREIMSALKRSVREELVCLWGEAEHMEEFPGVFEKLRGIREWNLVFERGELIRGRDVQELKSVPLKYPAELESQVRQAVLLSNREDVKKCYYRLYDLFRREPRTPGEIKECLLRFNMAALSAYKTQHEVQSELNVYYSMQKIADAISWKEIRSAMEGFFQALDFDTYEEEGDGSLSPLIRKAVQLVRKYYDQGITLEEMAERLFVSEEYLSAQFKKETGSGFAETVRSMRIDRIKGLLANTRLKLNQIAELTGYADPKYMSKVFKDEVGMLPTEFRKTVH